MKAKVSRLSISQDFRVRGARSDELHFFPSCVFQCWTEEEKILIVERLRVNETGLQNKVRPRELGSNRFESNEV